MGMQSQFERFLTQNRGLVIAGFAVPASFVYNLWEGAGNWFYRTFKNTHREHDAAVIDIQARVREGYKSGKPMCTARKPWKTMSLRLAEFKSASFQVPINLRNVLDIDTDRMVVRAEPMVTMGDITHFLVKRGLALAVQVEMDDLTLGGLCMGVGIETSSHSRGFLFETVKAFEVVTADGELVRCTRDENADLFHALPWSHGTLGFLVAVELELVRIASHVELTYHPCHSMQEFCQTLERYSCAESPPTLVEGLIYSRNSGVVMTGEFREAPRGATVNPINRFYKRWFHTHAETTLKTGPATEFIPVRHYFHRHTPGVFFQLRDLIPFANNRVYRALWGWMGAPKISLMKFSMTQELRRQSFRARVAQDIIVPIETLGASVEKAHELFEIYPMWVCPVRLFDHGEHEGFLRNPPNGQPSQMFVDLGVYGIPPAVLRDEYKPVRTARAFEEFVRGQAGYHMLYADICMTRTEFQTMFAHTNYFAVRDKFNATKAFPEIYDKVIPEKWLIDLTDQQTLQKASK